MVHWAKKYELYLKFLLQQHQETECPLYPVVCNKCSKDGIPREKVSGNFLDGKLLGRCRGKRILLKLFLEVVIKRI